MMFVPSQQYENIEQKSRKVLSSLLDQQISRNQILSRENQQLEQQQGKLIKVLQAKSEELQAKSEELQAKNEELQNALEQISILQQNIQQLQSVLSQKDQQLQRAHQLINKLQQQQLQHQNNLPLNHEYQSVQKRSNNDTTLEQTMILGRSKARELTLTAETEREQYEREKRVNSDQKEYQQIFQQRQKEILALRQELAHRASQFQELQETSLKQKDYYLHAMESLENKYSQEISAMAQKMTQLQHKLKSTESSSIQSSSKNRKTYEEMTKRILELQEKEHELSMVEKILQDKEEKIKKLTKNQNKLIEQLTMNEQKIKGLQENQKKQIKQQVQIYEKEIQLLHKTLQQQTNKHKKQLQKTRETILEQTKQCLVQELQKQKQLSRQSLIGVEDELIATKKMYKEALEKNEQQLGLIIQIEERCKGLESKLGEREKELIDRQELLMKSKQQSEKSTREISQLKNFIQQLSYQLKQKQSQLTQLNQSLAKTSQSSTQQLSNLQQKHNKLKLQHQNLLTQFSSLDEEYKNTLAAKETAELEVDKLQQKIIKEQQRKDKLIGEYKSTFEELRVENQQLNERNSQLEQTMERLQCEKEEVEKRWGKQLQQVKQKFILTTKQNSTLKQQLTTLQHQTHHLTTNYQNRLTQSKTQHQLISKSLKSLSYQKQHFKKLNDELKQSNLQLKHQNQQLLEKNQQLKSTLTNCEEQLQMLREEIVNLQLTSSQKEELQKLKSQQYEMRAKINYSQQTINIKNKEIADLTKDLFALNQSCANQKIQLDRYQKLQKTLRQQITTIATKNKQLQKALKDRCSQLDKSMPYLNQVIEEKKMMQQELQKLSAEIKKRDHTLELAKRTKADEIIHMREEIANLTKKLESARQQSQQAKELIEKYNREKVNILRESTSRGDELKRYEKENKALKQELIKMKDIQTGLQEQLENVYKVMEMQQDQSAEY